MDILYGIILLIAAYVLYRILQKYPIQNEDIFKRQQSGYVGVFGLVLIGAILIFNGLKRLFV